MISYTLRTFANRIGFCVTCVIPAVFLSADPIDEQDKSHLRADASWDLLSYIWVTRVLEDGVYLARVAASPACAAKGYTVLLSEEQLYHALPWDHRLSSFIADDKNKRPEYILDVLHTHAEAIQPLGKVSTVAGTVVAPATAAAFDAKYAQTVKVNADALQATLGLAPANIAEDTAKHIIKKSTYHMQQAFLRVAIDDLMAQLYQGQDRAHALTVKAKCALIAYVQRWHRQTRQQVVDASLAFDAPRQLMMWQLTIGVPGGADLAA